MNDTDRQIVETLHNVDFDCCQSCVNGCNADSPDQQICTLLVTLSRLRAELSRRRYSKSVCDLWEKRT